MCKYNLDLHKNKNKKKLDTKKKVSIIKEKEEKPNAAQVFFLMNEDILH